ncbi:hypothetical protein GCM10009836_29600 [Pseudonocardia ailaonensis]|uniref:Uncharacterized protein n=1 Tax=Pseudonocardia ailaonensis TaxID=367279 RepID=A0ABN2N164_9PSEU
MALQVGTVTALLAVAALGLPWWEAPIRSVHLDRLAEWRATELLGADLAGGLPATVLVALALGTLAVAGLGTLGRLGRRARGLHVTALLLSGGASTAAASAMLLTHGGSLPGPWLTAILGAVAVAGAAHGLRPRTAAHTAARTAARALPDTHARTSPHTARTSPDASPEQPATRRPAEAVVASRTPAEHPVQPMWSRRAAQPERPALRPLRTPTPTYSRTEAATPRVDDRQPCAA